MGHIKEPIGIDFIIQSEPLTDTERKGISEYIRNYKENLKKTLRPKNRIKNTKGLAKA